MKLTIDEVQFLVEALDAIKHEREDKALRAKLMDERHRLVGIKEADEMQQAQERWADRFGGNDDQTKQRKVLPQFWVDAYGSEEIVHAAPKTALRAHLAPKLFEAMDDILEYLRDLERRSEGTPFALGMEALSQEVRNRIADRLAPRD